MGPPKSPKPLKGRYPYTIDEVISDKENEFYLSRIADPWARPYIYKIVDGKPHIFCYGKDGIPGGTGEDKDFEWPEP